MDTFQFVAILFTSLAIWEQWLQMRKILFGIIVSTTELRTELFIKCEHKHLGNFENNSDEI